MTFASFKAWAQQPTTIHFFGVVAMAIVGTLSHYLGANQEWAAGLGIASYALVHAGINDSSASKPLEKLVEDSIDGYVKGRIQGVLPAVMQDLPSVISSFGANGQVAVNEPNPNPQQRPPANWGAPAVGVFAMLFLLVSVAACSTLPGTTSSVAATISTGQQDLQLVLNSWPIDKGILEVGSTGLTLAGQPAAAALVTAGIVKTDALVQQTQTVLDAGTATAAALEALASQFTTSVASLKAVAAPKITVVPNQPA